MKERWLRKMDLAGGCAQVSMGDCNLYFVIQDIVAGEAHVETTPGRNFRKRDFSFACFRINDSYRRKRLTIGRRCGRMIDLHAQHSDREHGTLARAFAFRADVAMLRLDQRLGERKTKTQAAVFARHPLDYLPMLRHLIYPQQFPASSGFIGVHDHTLGRIEVCHYSIRPITNPANTTAPFRGGVSLLRRAGGSTRGAVGSKDWPSSGGLFRCEHCGFRGEVLHGLAARRVELRGAFLGGGAADLCVVQVEFADDGPGVVIDAKRDEVGA